MNTIYAWGYGDLLVKVLQGLASLFDPSAGLLITLAKIAVLLGFVAVLVGYFSDYGQRDPLRIVKFYVLVVGVWAVFMNVRTTAQVHDLQVNQTQVVQNVPLAIVKPLAFFSQVQRSLSRVVDLAFGTPNACQYSTSGFMGCYMPVSSALGMRITDPYLLISFNEFVQNCVLTNVYDGTVDLNTMMTSDNLLYWLGYNLHPARFTKVYADSQCNYGSSSCSPCRGGYSCTCPDAWNNIQSRLQQYAGGDALKALSAITGLSTSAVSNALGQAPPYLLGVQQTGTALLAQTIAINQTYTALKSLAPGVDTAVGSVQRQTEQMGIANAILGSKYLPVVRGLMTVLVVALLPALFIFLFTPLAKQFLVGYITLFTWLTLWVFGEAVVHNLFMAKLSSMSSNMAGQGLKPITMLMLPTVQNTAMDYLAMIGNYYWLIPTIAFAVATGFSIYGFKAVAGGATGQTVAGKETVSQTGMGSFSAGQVAWNNTNAGNRSWGNVAAYGMNFMNSSVFNASANNLTGNQIQTVDPYGNILSGYGNNLAVMSYGKTLGEVYKGMGKYLDNESRKTLEGLIARHGENAMVQTAIAKGGRLESILISSPDGSRTTIDQGNPNVINTDTGITGFQVYRDPNTGDYVYRNVSGNAVDAKITDAYRKELAEEVAVLRKLADMAKTARTVGDKAVISKAYQVYKEGGWQKLRDFFSRLEKGEASGLKVDSGSKAEDQNMREKGKTRESYFEGYGEFSNKTDFTFGGGVIKNTASFKFGGKRGMRNTRQSRQSEIFSNAFFASLAEYLDIFTRGVGGSSATDGTFSRGSKRSSTDYQKSVEAQFQKAVEDIQTKEQSLSRRLSEVESSGLSLTQDARVRFANELYQAFRSQGYSAEEARKLTEEYLSNLDRMVMQGDKDAINAYLGLARSYAGDRIQTPEELIKAKEATQVINPEQQKPELEKKTKQINQTVVPRTGDPAGELEKPEQQKKQRRTKRRKT